MPPKPARSLSRLTQNNSQGYFISWYKEEVLRELLLNYFRSKQLFRPAAFTSFSLHTLKRVPVSVQILIYRFKSTNVFFIVTSDGPPGFSEHRLKATDVDSDKMNG